MWIFGRSVLVELLQDQNRRLSDQNDWLQRRLEHLTDQILQMKREGYVYYSHAPARAEQELDPRVENAIKLRARGSTTLARELTEFALQALGQDADPADVEAMILEGGSLPDEMN